MAQFDETVKRLKEAQDLAKSRVAKGVDSQADPKDVLLDDEDTKQPKSELAKCAKPLPSPQRIVLCFQSMLPAKRAAK